MGAGGCLADSSLALILPAFYTVASGASVTVFFFFAQTEHRNRPLPACTASPLSNQVMANLFYQLGDHRSSWCPRLPGLFFDRWQQGAAARARFLCAAAPFQVSRLFLRLSLHSCVLSAGWRQHPCSQSHLSRPPVFGIAVLPSNRSSVFRFILLGSVLG